MTSAPPTRARRPGPPSGVANGGSRDHAHLAGHVEDTTRLAAMTGFSAVSVLMLAPQMPIIAPQVAHAATWYRWSVVMPCLLVLFLPLVVGGAELLRRRTGGRPVPARFLCPATIGALLAVHVATNLAVLALAPGHPGASWSLGRPSDHLVTTCTLLVPAGMTVIAFAPVTSAALVTGLGLLQVLVRHLVGGEALLSCCLDLATGLITITLICLYFMWLRRWGRRLDAAVEARAAEQEEVVRLGARFAGRLRVSHLIHDRVIAVLVMARPAAGVPDERIRAEASRALEVLGPQSAPGGRDATAGALLTRLSRWRDPLERDGHHLRLSVDGDPNTPVDPQAWGDLASACDEALRNAQRHGAGKAGRRVTCSVQVTARPGVVTVRVMDDGVGFDPHGQTAGLGVTGSILARMRACPGGEATLTSAPGHGTRVDLAWRDRVEQPTAATRAALGEDVHLARGVETPQARAGAAAFLCVVWFEGLVQVRLFDGAWHTLTALLLVTAMVVAAMRSTGGVLRHGDAAVVLASAALAPAVLMSGCVEPTVLDRIAWPVSLGVLALIAVLFRGRFGVALAAAVLLCVSLTAGCAMAGADVPALVPGYVLYQVCTFMATCVSVATALGIEAHVARTVDTLGRAWRARISREEALAAATALMATVVSLASPVLTRLAHEAPTRPISSELRSEALRLEAELRDLIRAPRLAQDGGLARQVRRARERGAVVALVDDSATATSSASSSGWTTGVGRRTTVGFRAEEDGLPAALLAPAVEVLSRSGPGDRVAIRLCPPHAPQIATVQLTGHEGADEFHEVHAPPGGGPRAR